MIAGKRLFVKNDPLLWEETHFSDSSRLSIF